MKVFLVARPAAFYVCVCVSCFAAVLKYVVSDALCNLSCVLALLGLNLTLLQRKMMATAATSA